MNTSYLNRTICVSGPTKRALDTLALLHDPTGNTGADQMAETILREKWEADSRIAELQKRIGKAVAEVKREILPQPTTDLHQ